MNLARKVNFIMAMGASTLLGSVSHAGIITSYSNRGAFTTALGLATFDEDFSPGAAFPIPGGVLNSSSAYQTISAGEILPGVTYSVSSTASYGYFNIDAGAGYGGGFLDSLSANVGLGEVFQPLHVTFDNPVAGFGFDTNDLMGAFSVTVGSSVFNDSSAGFYGFISSSPDISSVSIESTSNNTDFNFDLDNFTYPTSSAAASGSVPDATDAAGLLGLALAGLGMMRRRVGRKA